MGGREGWRDIPAGGRARVTGGGRVHVGGAGSDWWDGSYWGGKRVIRCVAKHGVQVAPAGLGDKTVGRSQRGVSRRTNGR